jgi:ribokinase
MMNKLSMVVIGQLTLDDIVSFAKPPMVDIPGGSALYAVGGAYMLRRGRIGFVTRKGVDFDFSVIKAACGDFIDMDGVVKMPIPCIHIWSMFDRCGHRYFINQRWSGQDTSMSPVPEDIPQHYFNDTGAFLITAFPFTWQSEIIKAMPDDAIVMVDPHFGGIYSENRSAWNTLLGKVTLFMPSEEEMIRFFAIDRLDDLRDYVPYLKLMSGLGPEVVCIKVGPRGSLAYDKKLDACWHMPAYPGKVVDVTGCGDAFCGGFLCSYVEDHDVFEAMICGTVSSSINLERFGSFCGFEIPREYIIDRRNSIRNSSNREKQRIG